MGQLMLQGFNGFAEAFNALGEFVAGHPIVLHQCIKGGAIDVDLGFAIGGMGGIQFLGQHSIRLTELIQQLR